MLVITRTSSSAMIEDSLSLDRTAVGILASVSSPLSTTGDVSLADAEFDTSVVLRDSPAAASGRSADAVATWLVETDGWLEPLLRRLAVRQGAFSTMTSFEPVKSIRVVGMPLDVSLGLEIARVGFERKRDKLSEPTKAR